MIFNTFFSKPSQNKNTNDETQIIFDIIRNLNGKELKNAILKDNTRFDSLGLSSMRYIEFIIKLEEATKIDLEKIAAEIDFLAIETIGDLARSLRNLKKVD